MKSLTPAKVSMIMFLVVGGLIVAYVAKGLFAKEEKKPTVGTRNVPMAIADLPAGTLIRDEHLGMGPVLNTQLRPDMLLQTRVVVGRVTREAIKAAKPILAGQLYEPGATPTLPTAAGKRAITIMLRDANKIVDGLIKPGEFVDVLFTVSDLNDDPRTGKGMTVRLMKGIKVLAINRMVLQGPLDTDRNSVTFEVSEVQANALTLANERGTITLVHTPDGEGDGKLALAEMTSRDRATLEGILGLAPQKPEAPPTPKPPFLSQIYRMTGRQDLRFAPTGEIIDNFGGWYTSPYYLQQQHYWNFYQQNPQLLPQILQQQYQQQQKGNQPQSNGNGAPGAGSAPTPVSTPGLGRPESRPRPSSTVSTWGDTAVVPKGPSA